MEVSSKLGEFVPVTWLIFVLKVKYNWHIPWVVPLPSNSGNEGL